MYGLELFLFCIILELFTTVSCCIVTAADAAADATFSCPSTLRI